MWQCVWYTYSLVFWSDAPQRRIDFLRIVGDVLSCHVCVLSGNLVADPLCWHGATRARVAQEYLLATEAGLKAMYKYTFPFIVFHGADDTLTDPDGSQQLFERSKVRHSAASVVRLSGKLERCDQFLGIITHEGAVEACDIAINDILQRYVACGCTSARPC